MPNYWTISAGDNDRKYVDYCLEWEVILIGPGEFGPWPQCEKNLRVPGTQKNRNTISSLKRFAGEMKQDDVVVLRVGTSEVYGVGLIKDAYGHDDMFGDVDGWDIQHFRRVKWLWDYRKNNSDQAKKFPSGSMGFGYTLQQLKAGIVKNWVYGVLPKQPPSGALKSLLGAGKKISLTGIENFLTNKKIGSSVIATIKKELKDLGKLANWYYINGKPSEHETVAYLVVPLLRSLGWEPEVMAIEWKWIDVALFSGIPRDDNNLRVVVEVKRMGLSCLTAIGQAAKYASKGPKCDRIIVTDGIRYGVYKKGSGGFELKSYLNLTRFRDSYPIYSCGGAQDALFDMRP